MTKVLLVVNPSSGGEKATEFQELAEKSLQKMFDEVKTVQTEGAGDATKFAKQSAEENYDALFVMGGDGTVNEAISGLAELPKRPQFGFFPLGTVNDLARALGISLDPEEAIQDVVNCHVRKLDIGKINEHYFMNVVAIGNIAEAVDGASVEEKSKMGKFAYYWSGFKSFINNEAHDFELDLDGKKETFRGSTMIISLTNSVGGFEQLLPKAKIDDGLLHLIYIKDESHLDLVKAAPQLLKGVEEDHENLGYTAFTEGTIRILDGAEMFANVDGDQGDNLPIHLKVLPSHLDVYCPKN